MKFQLSANRMFCISIFTVYYEVGCRPKRLPKRLMQMRKPVS